MELDGKFGSLGGAQFLMVITAFLGLVLVLGFMANIILAGTPFAVIVAPSPRLTSGAWDERGNKEPEHQEFSRGTSTGSGRGSRGERSKMLTGYSTTAP
ncbi:hypothetical protein E6H29_06785 [Candidatus Bathyarchaeota archaeon]|nr:MAG: hypothetical protein E6H29_06785 [Candidatus Bathyarchaeota archaeon]